MIMWWLPWYRTCNRLARSCEPYIQLSDKGCWQVRGACCIDHVVLSEVSRSRMAYANVNTASNVYVEYACMAMQQLLLGGFTKGSR